MTLLLGFTSALQPVHTTFAFWKCRTPAHYQPPNWPVGRSDLDCLLIVYQCTRAHHVSHARQLPAPQLAGRAEMVR
jgi:hypothetical protein